MTLSDTHRPALLTAAVIALLLIIEALAGWKILERKRLQLQRETAAVLRWQAQRDQLTPVEGRWRATFPAAAAVQDLAGLYRVLRIEPLRVDPDTLMVEAVRPEQWQGIPLGVSRICVRTAGAQGLVAGAATVTDALTALAALTVRPDLRIGEVTLSLNRGRPRLLLGDFCVVVRERSDEK